MVKRKKPKNNKQSNDDREGVDYAATADAFFPDKDDDDEADQVVEREDYHENDDSDDDDQSQSSSSEQSGSEEDASGSDDDDENEQEPTNDVVVSEGHGEQCTFDLHNLLAVNSHQIDTSKLYQKKKNSNKQEDDKDITIPNNQLIHINEDYLLEKASDGCTQLIAALWQLPVERSDAGPMVTLPAFDSSRIPRALPPPPPKQETKWEKFAKERGIELNKKKRSRKVWDEATGTWMFRHGYQKANDKEGKEWPIMEVKANQDPYADPWERVREEKRARTNKNVESRMRNEERAGNIPKGTTTRMLKSREKIRQAGKAGGDRDRDHLPSGVPVDLRPSRDAAEPSSGSSTKLRGKASTMAALVATQRSTASLGKFDKHLEGEPERKHAAGASKKRRYESATDKKLIASEAERSMKLFRSAVEGGGAERDKARRKGHLAKGETAYDYDFDDGLGASSFRKKKGRAGAGKMKKMTKKRVK